VRFPTCKIFYFISVLHFGKRLEKQDILEQFCASENILFYKDFAPCKMPCKYQILQYKFPQRKMTHFA